MKKIAVLLVLVALVAGAYGLSVQTSSRVAEAHARVVDALAETDHVRVLEHGFESGWADSSGAVAVEIGGPAGRWLQAQLRRAGLEHARAKVGLRLETQVAHGLDLWLDHVRSGADGPFVAAVAVTTVAFDRETEADLDAAMGSIPPASLASQVHFDGRVESTVLWEAATLASRGGDAAWTMEWRGLDGWLTRSRDGSVSGHLASPGLAWRGPAGTLEVGGFALELGGAEASGGVWDGEVKQRWSDLRWTPHVPESEEEPAPEPTWAARDLRIDQNTRPALGGRRVRVFDVRAADGMLAGRPVASGLLTVSLSHAPVAPAPPVEGEGLESLLDPLARWLAARPSLDPIRLELASPDGTLTLEGHLALDPGDPAHLHPMLALEALDGALRLEATGRWLEAGWPGEGTLGLWIENGFAERVDGRTVASLRVLEGRIAAQAVEPQEDAPADASLVAEGSGAAEDPSVGDALEPGAIDGSTGALALTPEGDAPVPEEIADASPAPVVEAADGAARTTVPTEPAGGPAPEAPPAAMPEAGAELPADAPEDSAQGGEAAAEPAAPAT